MQFIYEPAELLMASSHLPRMRAWVDARDGDTGCATCMSCGSPLPLAIAMAHPCKPSGCRVEYRFIRPHACHAGRLGERELTACKDARAVPPHSTLFSASLQRRHTERTELSNVAV